MTTKAEWEVLTSHYKQYARSMVNCVPSRRLRLLVAMTNLVGAYELPDDVQSMFDDAIERTYERAIKGLPVIGYPLSVVFSVDDDDRIIVFSTRRSLALV